MRFLRTCRRNLRLRGLGRRLLRLAWRWSWLFGSGRFISFDYMGCDHIEQHHRSSSGSRWRAAGYASAVGLKCLRHLFHGAAATAAQVLSHRRTHKWFPGYFYFAATPGIQTSIVFIASNGLLISRSCRLRRHGTCSLRQPIGTAAHPQSIHAPI